MFQDELTEYVTANPEATRSMVRKQAELISRDLLSNSLFINKGLLGDGSKAAPLNNLSDPSQVNSVPAAPNLTAPDVPSASNIALGENNQSLAPLDDTTRALLLTKRGSETLKDMAAEAGMTDLEFMQWHKLVP